MENNASKYWLVIPAAGSGQRMRSIIPKQYLQINGKTVLEHTLSLFMQRDDIVQTVVCIAEGDEVAPKLSVFSNSKVTHTLGGASRAESVLNGLLALNDKTSDDDWVLVHDAARPCLSACVLQRLFDELDGDAVGGILAVPVKDTLKLKCESMGDSGVPRIETTLDRSTIWQAQTPQMFRYKLLKDALSLAIEHNIEITDEASALEAAGHKPKLIEGETRNLKITTPEDLELAEFLLK